jgi:hypothetical protein
MWILHPSYVGPGKTQRRPAPRTALARAMKVDLMRGAMTAVRMSHNPPVVRMTHNLPASQYSSLLTAVGTLTELTFADADVHPLGRRLSRADGRLRHEVLRKLAIELSPEWHSGSTLRVADDRLVRGDRRVVLRMVRRNSMRTGSLRRARCSSNLATARQRHATMGIAYFGAFGPVGGALHTSESASAVAAAARRRVAVCALLASGRALHSSRRPLWRRADRTLRAHRGVADQCVRSLGHPRLARTLPMPRLCATNANGSHVAHRALPMRMRAVPTRAVPTRAMLTCVPRSHACRAHMRAALTCVRCGTAWRSLCGSSQASLELFMLPKLQAKGCDLLALVPFSHPTLARVAKHALRSRAMYDPDAPTIPHLVPPAPTWSHPAPSLLLSGTTCTPACRSLRAAVLRVLPP